MKKYAIGIAVLFTLAAAATYFFPARVSLLIRAPKRVDIIPSPGATLDNYMFVGGDNTRISVTDIDPNPLSMSGFEGTNFCFGYLLSQAEVLFGSMGNKPLRCGESFHRLKLDPKQVTVQGKYIWDSRRVYKENRLLSWVDAKTFSLLENNNFGYYRDKHGVYNGSRKVRGLDPETAKVINYDYVKDDTRVYFRFDKIGKADPETFQLLDRLYSQDASHVFYKTEIVKDRAPDLYKSEGGFRVYRNRVTYGSVSVPGADMDTFELVHGAYAKDKDAVFFQGKKLGLLHPDLVQQSQSVAQNTYITDGIFVFKEDTLINKIPTGPFSGMEC
ncbi:MAG: hypothetical protein ACI83D_000376, partial [Planctomycetota bacterium]